ncbi:MAG: hypothetical protein ACYDC0_11460 [Acidimicrobiales bacterium]
MVGSTTLACAVGGALMGAAAFSAFPGNAPRAGVASERLTSGSTVMPSVIGSLCASTRNTATAADTSLSCENYGLSSFTVAMNRAANATDLAIQAALSSFGGSQGGFRLPLDRAAFVRRSSVGSGGISGQPGSTVPGGGSSSQSQAICETTPMAPSGAPSLPSSGVVSTTVSAGGATVSVKASSTGATVCGTAPKAPATTVPASGGVVALAVPSVTTPSVSGITGTSSGGSKTHHKSKPNHHTKHTKHTKHKKHKVTTTVTNVVNDVTGGLGGLGGSGL